MATSHRLLSFAAFYTAAIGSHWIFLHTWSWCGSEPPVERYPSWLVSGSGNLVPILSAAGCFVLFRGRPIWIIAASVVMTAAVYHDVPPIIELVDHLISK